jgi:ribosomal protein S10
MSPNIKKKTRFIISITGYDHPTTKIASQEISNFFTSNNYNLLAVVKLPIKSSGILSPRRCHFIYKESRDQFVKDRHKIVLFVDFDNEKSSELPEKIRKVHIPAGVNVNIKVKNM